MVLFLILSYFMVEGLKRFPDARSFRDQSPRVNVQSEFNIYFAYYYYYYYYSCYFYYI